MFQSIGFIGTGNMGCALAKAVHSSGLAPSIHLANRTQAKAQALADQLPGSLCTDNETIAQTCDLIFLGVKPQMMAGVLAQLGPILASRTDRFVLCSMAAGLTFEALTALMGREYPLIRILPNTPASIGQGVAQFCVNDAVTPEEKADFCALLAPSGLLDEMGEAMMTAANCISGCGIAFAALFLEGLADGGVACGMPRDMAYTCAAQTMVGTGALYLAEKKHPGAMKDAVCSPGGVTIQGVRTLEERGFRGACMDAVISAYQKALDLAKH